MAQRVGQADAARDVSQWLALDAGHLRLRLGQLNHYAVRSAESFLVKRDRGRVNHVDRDQGLNYWFRMNHNAQVEDLDAIALMLPAARAEFDRPLAFADIGRAHAASVAAHRDKDRRICTPARIMRRFMPI